MMTIDEYHEIWAPLAEKICPEPCGGCRELAMLLGVHAQYVEFINRPAQEDYPMNQELKELLLKLSGPHGHALLKVYRIRKGLEK